MEEVVKDFLYSDFSISGRLLKALNNSNNEVKDLNNNTYLFVDEYMFLTFLYLCDL